MIFKLIADSNSRRHPHQNVPKIAKRFFSVHAPIVRRREEGGKADQALRTGVENAVVPLGTPRTGTDGSHGALSPRGSRRDS